MPGNEGTNETLTKGIQLSYNVTRLRRDPNYITLYVNWFLLLTTGIIPMGALIFLNSRIYAKILETRRLRERCRIRSSTVIALQARNADSTTTQGFIKQTLKVAFFQKVWYVFQISKSPEKKYSKKTILNLKFKFPANNIFRITFRSCSAKADLA